MSNLIICPDCGKEISASAKQCPNCGCPNKESDIFTQDINSDSIKRNPGCIAIAVVVFMFLFVSFMEGFEEGKNKKTGKEKETIYSVGQTVSLGSWNYKVNKYEWATVWFKKRFVVNISIKNTAKNPGAILPFSLIDENGNRFTDYEVQTFNSLATGETIQPSLEKTGNLYFNVPEGRKYLIEVRNGIFFEGAFLGDIRCIKLYDEKQQQSKPKGISNKVDNNTKTTKKVITTNFGDEAKPKEKNDYNKSSKDEQSQPENVVKYDMDTNKVFIELNKNIGDYALGAANVVKDFYTNYLNNNCRLDNWITNKNLMPLTRQIFLMLKYTGDYLDYDFVVNGQDYGNTWKINTVQVNRDTALVGVENSFDGKEARNIKIICKYVNGKWFIDDIEEAKKEFFSYLNGNSTLGVVNSYELPIFSKKYKPQNIYFYDSKNRIISLVSKTSDYYLIDSYNNLDNKIDSKLTNSEWFVKPESVITFNFLNKIRKGESKYLAYMILGEPVEDSSNKLFYSPNDYICYDNNSKITSWTGFDDFKVYFDDGTGSNNQNIGFVNAKSGINLRKEPNTKSEKVCGFPFNCRVMILDNNGPQATIEKITSKWCLITNGTKVGWAFGGFIREER